MSNFWGAHHFGLWRKLIGLSWHSLADCFAAVWRVSPPILKKEKKEEVIVEPMASPAYYCSLIRLSNLSFTETIQSGSFLRAAYTKLSGISR